MYSNWNLNYFNTGEWQVVEERLNDLHKSGISFCPNRSSLFRPLRTNNPAAVRVVILGQDPYPNPRYATGQAFSTHKAERTLPASLRIMFDELVSDLRCDRPLDGDLSPWVKQGVFLWNAYPSCQAWKAGSHHWYEWEILTKELVEKLDAQGVVFAALGTVAASFVSGVKSPCICTSHPSPLSAKRGFIGSRLFSSINSKLTGSPIDWTLNGKQTQEPSPVQIAATISSSTAGVALPLVQEANEDVKDRDGEKT